jgi:hypothetical protein
LSIVRYTHAIVGTPQFKLELQERCAFTGEKSTYMSGIGDLKIAPGYGGSAILA